MNLKVSAFVFATFFINCIVIGLLVASFITDHWIVATTQLKNNNGKSHGDINFGLFSGLKQLSLGYGVRPSAIDVRQIMRDEPDVLNYWLWLGTAVGGGLGVFASAVGAIAAVVKTAAPAKKKGTMVLLFVSHICAVLSTCLAFICWLVHFLQQLRNNILTSEDRQLWHTESVHLGHSFYFVVGSVLLILVNILLISMAVYWERRDRRRRRRFTEPPVDEKTHGAIMLY